MAGASAGVAAGDAGGGGSGADRLAGLPAEGKGGEGDGDGDEEEGVVGARKGGPNPPRTIWDSWFMFVIFH